jgi:ABC-type glycerol-3-phosphate transport system substrate-binding protein
MNRWAALVVLAATTSACGASGGGAAIASPSQSLAAVSSSPTPSPRVLNFKLNGIKTSATGAITVTVLPGSVTIEIVITGLQSNSVHVSHVHVGSCQQPGNILLALNPVLADGQGNSDTRSTLNATYPPTNGTWYAVVHAGPDMQGSNATYLLCGNLFA